MGKPVLLCSYLGSCSWRVRIVLQVKKIDFDYRPVDLKPNGEQQTAKFKTFNPMGQVPVLLVDGKPISQSVAIMEYLEEQYPKPAMLPMDPYLKAKCREVVELLVSGVHPLQSPSMIPFLGRTEWKEWAHRSISRGFAALEATLAETAGRYCFGDEVTFADACLLPQVHNAERIGVDVTPFPTVRRICEALRQHPLVKEADPSCQPDTPPTGVPNTFDLFRDPKNQ
ncbi:maleylacetoacetate isomerase isoform X2 [Rhipicephalus microplus]|uniref:maleylacetoacetate isomerase isoform X2 n=1 Tax=Rhipicephalus microplus TaxID=6941 RepID=UPI001888FCB8|nr:maleylacetoacetate isomerase-like [Rhipicephalus microplus]